MGLKPLLFFLLTLLFVTTSAFAEPIPETSTEYIIDNANWQQKIIADEKEADQLQIGYRNYYRDYIPNAVSVNDSYAKCMKACTDLAGDCPSKCRGDYVQKTTVDSVTDVAPANGYAGATNQKCYDWVAGATPDPKLNLPGKACNGGAIQQVADPNNPVVHGGFDDQRRSRTSDISGTEQPKYLKPGTNKKAAEDARNALRDALANRYNNP